MPARRSRLMTMRLMTMRPAPFLFDALPSAAR